MKAVAAIALASMLSGCAPIPPWPAPTVEATASPSLTQSPRPEAIPNGTISIGCFIATQSVIDDIRHLVFQINELPISTEKDVLVARTATMQSVVVAAPPGCFSGDELLAFEAYWSYVRVTPARQLSKKRIEELLTATGFPYPTFAP
jgi:hypothetical protein